MNKIQIFKNEEWLDVELKSLKEKDIFRIITTNMNPNNFKGYYALCDAFQNKDGIWSVNITDCISLLDR